MARKSNKQLRQIAGLLNDGEALSIHLAKTGRRIDVMPSRVHGKRSRRTERRAAKQMARAGGWGE